MEKCSIRKNTTSLLNDYYNTNKTSLLIFHFDPFLFPSSKIRMKQALIKQIDIEGKDLYVIDDFFSKDEGELMRDFSKKATFSIYSYGSQEAIEKGERPARSMNSKERWSFFSSPLPAMQEFYKLLANFAYLMDAEITTLPWDLCAQGTNTSSVVGNFLEEVSCQSMELGKHRDSYPERGVSFGIPILYGKENGRFYDPTFINGEEGKPWVISAMLYTTEEGFLPEYQMGTVFYKDNEKECLFTNCYNMRLVFFEGDIVHSIEESKIPSDLKTWRISYVFKLVINPRKQGESMKRKFSEIFKTFNPEKSVLKHGSRI